MLLEKISDQLLERALTEHGYFCKIQDELNGFVAKIRYGFGSGEVKPFPVSIFPVFLDEKKVNGTYKELKLVLSALVKVREEFLVNKLLREYVSLPDDEMKIILCDVQANQISSVRFDTFFQTDGTVKVVEVNSDYPDGFSVLTELVTYHQQLPHLKNISKIITPKKLVELMLQSMLSAYQMNGGTGSPTIGLFAPTDRWWHGEYYSCEKYLKKLGCDVHIIDPLKMEFKNGKLFSGGKRINIVRKCTEMFYFVKNYERLLPFFEGCKNNNFIVYNNFKDRLIGYKALFEVLTDESWHHLFTVDEIKAIKKYVPLTRRIQKNGTITIDKVEKDAVEFLTKNQDSFIIKPSGDAEGHGVSIGDELTKEEWAARVKDAVLLSKNGSNWIVQERIIINKRRLLRLENGKFVSRNVNYDLMFYLLGSKEGFIEGPIQSRSSDSVLVNIAQGGALHPVYVVSN